MIFSTRHLLIYLYLFAFPVLAVCQDKTLPPSLVVLGQPLVLRENVGDARGALSEYIEKESTFDNWKLMFALRFVTEGDRDPKASALRTAEVISKRKKEGDHYANAAVFELKNKGVAVIDFLASDKNFIEHNIWKYFISKKGLMSYQLARRVYIDEKHPEKTKEFLQEIQDSRTKFMDELFREDLPTSGFAK